MESGCRKDHIPLIARAAAQLTAVHPVFAFTMADHRFHQRRRERDARFRNRFTIGTSHLPSSLRPRQPGSQIAISGSNPRIFDACGKADFRVCNATIRRTGREGQPLSAQKLADKPSSELCRSIASASSTIAWRWGNNITQQGLEQISLPLLSSITPGSHFAGFLSLKVPYLAVMYHLLSNFSIDNQAVECFCMSDYYKPE